MNEINSNSIIANPNLLNRMINLAIQGNKPGACQLLDTYDLTQGQKKAVAEILTNAPPCQEADIPQLKQRILTELTPKVELPTLCDAALINIVSCCNIKAMSTFSIICHEFYAFIVPEACVEQLRHKKSLTMQELAIYQKRMSEKPNDWDCVFQHCKELEALSFFEAFQIQGSKIQEAEIASIIQSAAKYCPHLRGLDFTSCFAVGDKTLACLGKHLPNLTHLNLTFCKYGTKGIQALVQGCPNLISLDLSFHGVGDREILLIANHCPKLCELNLIDSCSKFFSGPVTDASIRVLAEKCPLLTHLYIPSAQITDLSLQALAEHCTGLVYFFHRSCLECTKEGLDILRQQLPNLVTSKSVEDYYVVMEQNYAQNKQRKL